MPVQCPLQIGSGRGGDAGRSSLGWTGGGGSMAFLDQNFGVPISFKQEAFQYSPAAESGRLAFTACATASISVDSG
jgi:hypothetical protein